MYSEVNLHSGTEGRPVCRFVTYPMTEEQKGPREPWPIFFWPNPVFAPPVWSACASCLKCNGVAYSWEIGNLICNHYEEFRNPYLYTVQLSQQNSPLKCQYGNTSSNVKIETSTGKDQNAVKIVIENLLKNIRTSRPSQQALPAGRRPPKWAKHFVSSICI